MAFRLSRCVGLVCPEPSEAAEFYVRAFDMRPVEADDGLCLSAGPIRLYLDTGPLRPLVLELVTPGAEAARGPLKRLGFEETLWRGAGKSCLVVDPFGLAVNLYEDPEAFEPEGLAEPEEGWAKPCVGVLAPDPEGVAAFYSSVLGSPAGRLPDGSVAVESGGLRLRVRAAAKSAPCLWLGAGADLERLAHFGCATEDGVLTDRYGLHWVADTADRPDRAAVRMTGRGEHATGP
jgi:catechol 2,3-dioxygenase-like lactoylglutathione lyase family enzyme